MKPSEKKIVKQLIKNVINRQYPNGKDGFQISFYSLLKEIEYSINLYIKREQIGISRIEKEKLIIKEFKVFIELKIIEYYNNLKEDTNQIEKSEDSYEEDDVSDADLDSDEDASDDPNGPNF